MLVRTKFTPCPKRALPILTAALVLGNTSANALDMAIPPHDHSLEEIVVSGAFEGRKLGETILGATVLKSDELRRQLNGSIGETLRRQPGISSTFFGPGASRPVIRGLGGDRIRVLDFGLGSIDASSTSPDHAVAVEPALAERIEILRGTAMLMYGSSAAGGVINVLDGRIPSDEPEGGFEGAVRYGHSSVDDGDEVAAAANLSLGSLGGSELVFHGDFSYRNTDDYKIPGFAESATLRAAEAEEGAEVEEIFGLAENSATENTSGSAGLSLLFDDGFFGVNLKLLGSNYGVPGGHAEEEGEAEPETEEEAAVTIDLDQLRFDLHGELERDMGPFKKAKFRFGYADYEHTELEGTEIGTSFLNEGFESRLDLIEKGGESWSGATGLQVRSRDFSAIGAEAFVPATKSTQLGIYSVKEFSMGRWQTEFGGRLEYTKHAADELNVTRSFTGISLSTGAGYDISDRAFAGVSLYRTERAPTTEALFSNGPHLATNAFERGNSDIGLETAFGVEATFTYSNGGFSFVVNGYVTSYSDFIYEANTGEIDDDLPVFEFRAADARLYGFESKTEIHLGTNQSSTFGEINWHLDGQVDLVRAQLRGISGDRDLPRIPPLSALLGIEASTELFDVRTELEYAAEQNRIATAELPTDDYLLWNAYATLRPFKDKNLSLEFRASNITNKDARQHTSFLKDLVPLPGRNIKLSLRAAF